MAASKHPAPERTSSGLRRLRFGLLLGLGLGLLVWVAFFDSHSLAKRFAWHQELHQFSAENAALQAQIGVLEEGLEATPSASVVEEIAREQYGMRRPGETVYRVEEGGGKEERKKGGMGEWGKGREEDAGVQADR